MTELKRSWFPAEGSATHTWLLYFDVVGPAAAGLAFGTPGDMLFIGTIATGSVAYESLTVCQRAEPRRN